MIARRPGLKHDLGLEYHAAMASEGSVHHDASAPPAAALSFLLVLAVAFAMRVLGLGYNGPFIDESFHSVAYAYGNVPHLTGEVFLYPQLSRGVHSLAGLVGARGVSAVFGTLTVACVYRLAERFSVPFVPAERRWVVAGGAALLFSLSAPALFISQFANYYAMSVLLFALGLLWTLRGIETNRGAFLAAGAVTLVASYATRYLLLGYLPIAILLVLLRGRAADGSRVSAKAFWIPFAVAFIAYSGWNHEHLSAALEHAQQSGTGLSSERSLQLRGLVLWEALGRMAAVAVFAAIGLAAAIASTRGDDRPNLRRRRTDAAWLTLGFVWMIGYHVAFAHDLTMESNLAVALIFGSILAGLGVQYLAFDVLDVRRSALRAIPLVAAFAAAFVHGSAVVREDRTWPDWRPVVDAARARGADRAHSVWSTADNGGMRNTWGVRRSDPQMSGNVWHLRAALGPQVDVGSPWRQRQTAELLRLAVRKNVEFVIGPLPFRNLRVGSRVHGFVVTDVVDVPFGPACFILRAAGAASR